MGTLAVYCMYLESGRSVLAVYALGSEAGCSLEQALRSLGSLYFIVQIAHPRMSTWALCSKNYNIGSHAGRESRDTRPDVESKIDFIFFFAPKLGFKILVICIVLVSFSASSTGHNRPLHTRRASNISYDEDVT